MRAVSASLFALSCTTLMGWGNRDFENTQVNEPANREITPSARGCPQRNGVFTFADFLYWKANESNLQMSTKIQSELSDKTSLDGKWVRLHPDWEAGFRFGLGGNLPYDKWDLVAYYTYYYNNTYSERSMQTRDFGVGFYGNYLVGNEYQIPKIKGHYRLHYNVLDVELGRHMFLSRRLSFRPFVGVSSVWLRRLFSVYYGKSTVIDQPIVDSPGEFKEKSTSQGVGPKVGLGAKWWLSSQWKLFGNLAAALLFGRTHSQSSVYQYQQDPADPLLIPYWTKTAGFSDSDSAMMPWLQIQTGIDWGKCFSNWFNFSISAAWEANFWWDLPLLNNYNARAFNYARSSLSLNGLTLRFKLDF